MFAWVHPSAPRFGRVHSGSRDFARGAEGSSGSFGIAWVHSGAPRGHQVFSGSRGFPRAHLGVVEFIRVRVGSPLRANGHRVHPCLGGLLWRALVLSGSFAFA